MKSETFVRRLSVLAVLALLVAAGLFAAGDTEVTTTTKAAVTGGNEWHESPMLHDLVIAGKLPPLKERLPKDVMVEEVYEQIGVYGGDWRRTWEDYNSGKWAIGNLGEEALFRFAPDGSKVVPNVAKGYDVNEDATVFTIYLREGMKWSDGESFDADDVLFYWQHMLIPATFGKQLYDCYYTMVDGEKVRSNVEKIDQYTVRITHAAPFPLFLERVAIDNKWFFAPEHFMRTVLPEFVGEAETLRIGKEKGYGGDIKNIGVWTGYYYWIWPERPTIRPWMAKNHPTADVFVMERNPYYWKVDKEGNQLPYIDRIVTEKVGKDQAKLKLLAGEVDLGSIGPQEVPLFMDNAEKADIRLVQWKGVGGGVAFSINQTVENLKLRTLFRDVNFRAGLSHALDRDEINNIVWDGMLVPRQSSITPGLANYSKEWEQKFVKYDTKLAANYFDKVGLKWDSAKKWRTNPDGSDLTIIVTHQGGVEESKVVELAKNYWEQVNIKVVVKVVDSNYFHELKYGNKLEIGVDGGIGLLNIALRPDNVVPLRILEIWSGHYGLWRATFGEQGIEPDQDVMNILTYWDNLVSSTNWDDISMWADKIVDVHAKNVFVIGTCGEAPVINVLTNRFRNFPPDQYSCDEMRGYGVANPSTFFIMPK